MKKTSVLALAILSLFLSVSQRARAASPGVEYTCPSGILHTQTDVPSGSNPYNFQATSQTVHATSILPWKVSAGGGSTELVCSENGQNDQNYSHPWVWKCIYEPVSCVISGNKFVCTYPPGTN
jgi:hypothetical protein